MNISSSIAEVFTELLKTTVNVGNQSGKGKSKGKVKGFAGKSAGFKR
ncbi:hypothetical protein [Allopontixanthobacter sediminis]|uniref:Uncharacterized protein n=1 Tax=Allopontixanthobacter sediminis TaxID=1689985 RepID=A0A845AVL8_9SPHN|nr:hypothetical protein [Allopontixanthobacter sediminis]MXP43061.1 hypothetical protein [Allopontixanthobacter sediminis]